MMHWAGIGLWRATDALKSSSLVAKASVKEGTELAETGQEIDIREKLRGVYFQALARMGD
jgi:hypothetical protein